MTLAIMVKKKKQSRGSAGGFGGGSGGPEGERGCEGKARPGRKRIGGDGTSWESINVKGKERKKSSKDGKVGVGCWDVAGMKRG